MAEKILRAPDGTEYDLSNLKAPDGSDYDLSCLEYALPRKVTISSRRQMVLSTRVPATNSLHSQPQSSMMLRFPMSFGVIT